MRFLICHNREKVQDKQKYEERYHLSRKIRHTHNPENCPEGLLYKISSQKSDGQENIFSLLCII